MKRKSLIVGLIALIMITLSMGMAFADDDVLKVTSTYPKDGQKNTSIENVGVKVYFNHDISGDAVKKSNEAAIKIVDVDGKKIPIKVLAKGKELLVLGDSTNKKFKVNNNSEYKLVIDESFQDNDGRTLEGGVTVTFKTFNQKVNNYINMGLMVLMMGGIMVLSVKSVRGGDSKPAEATADVQAAFNPYREAKKTGKTVEEVIAEEKARREKEDKKNARKNKKAAAIREKLEAELDLSVELPYVYKVKEPRPISAAGSSYKSGRGKSREQEAVKRKQSKTRANSGKRGGKKK